MDNLTVFYIGMALAIGLGIIVAIITEIETRKLEREFEKEEEELLSKNKIKSDMQEEILFHLTRVENSLRRATLYNSRRLVWITPKSVRKEGGERRRRSSLIGIPTSHTSMFNYSRKGGV